MSHRAVSTFADLSLSQDVRKSVFGRFPENLEFYTINEARKQYSTIFFILDLQETGRHVVGFGDLSIDVFLEVQNERYS